MPKSNSESNQTKTARHQNIPNETAIDDCVFNSIFQWHYVRHYGVANVERILIEPSMPLSHCYLLISPIPRRFISKIRREREKKTAHRHQNDNNNNKERRKKNVNIQIKSSCFICGCALNACCICDVICIATMRPSFNFDWKLCAFIPADSILSLFKERENILLVFYIFKRTTRRLSI